MSEPGERLAKQLESDLLDSALLLPMETLLRMAATLLGDDDRFVSLALALASVHLSSPIFKRPV